jgi:uncharacterized protein (TIGR03067 family)
MFANHRAKTAVGIFVGLLLLGASRAEAKPAKGKGDLDKLQGVWAREGQVWVITGDELLEYYSGSRSTSKAKIQIDTSKRPNQIDFEYTRYNPNHGIYEVKGDTLKVCVSAKSNPRPREFKEIAPEARVWTFERRAMVTADGRDIHKTFLQNEALADETYSYRMVKVTGKVERVQREGGGYDILLTSKKIPLRFSFDSSLRSRLAKLKAGEKVTIRGVCLGKGKIKGDSGDEAILFVGGKIIEAREGEPE